MRVLSLKLLLLFVVIGCSGRDAPSAGNEKGKVEEAELRARKPLVPLPEFVGAGKLNTKELFKTRAAYADALPQLRKRTNEEVVDWKHAADPRIEWIPFWQVTDLIGGNNFSTPSRCTWLEDAKFAHGFDPQGRLSVIRTSELEAPYFSETYFFYGDGWIESITFFNKHMRDFVRYEMTDETSREHLFVYDDMIRVASWEFPSPAAAKLRVDSISDRGTTEFHYNITTGKNGQIEQVLKWREWLDGISPHRLYYVAPDDRSADEVAKDLEDAIVEATPKIIQSANINEPLCAVMLTYCGADIFSVYLSHIRAAAERDRNPIVAKWGKSAIWSPAEYGEEDSSSSPMLAYEISEDDFTVRARELRLVYKFIHEDGDTWFQGVHLMRSTLAGAALRLNELDWSTICPVAEEFVVIASDCTRESDVVADIVASVPLEKLNLLKDRGLIADVELLRQNDADPEENYAH